ncbi:MAG: hypothetical protein AAF467_06075 [Actinomycetota bacterium]
MARPLDTGPTLRSTEGRKRVGGSAGALAAALACLLVTSLVVERSSTALRPDGTSATLAFASGVIELGDDDAGRSLVNLAAMAPGRPEQSCIELHYTGTVLPVSLSLRADTHGDLAPYVLVNVERGRGGTFDDCSAFEPEGEVFVGTLAELAAEPLELEQLVDRDDRPSYRFTFDVVDTDDAVAKSAAADLVWEATAT